MLEHKESSAQGNMGMNNNDSVARVDMKAIDSEELSEAVTLKAMGDSGVCATDDARQDGGTAGHCEINCDLTVQAQGEVGRMDLGPNYSAEHGMEYT